MIMDRQLSGSLSEVERLFATYRREGRLPTERELAAFERIFRFMSDRACDLENENARLRFGAVDRWEHDTDALLKEVRRPGSNVTLFRVVPRPHYGGAA